MTIKLSLLPNSLSLWSRRLLRAVLGLLLALLLLLLGAWLGLPYWLEHRGVALASEQLGRTVSLESAHFRPWRLALELRGLRIAGPSEGAPALLELRRVEATLSLRSLRHLAPVLASLQIEAPSLRLAYLGQGRTDLDDILQRLAQRPKTPANASDEPPNLALYNIELSEGEVVLEDRPAGMQHRLEALSLGLPFISTLDAHDEVHVQPKLSGRLNGVDFRSDGEAQPFADKRNARLNVHLQALDLMAYQRYWPRELPVRLSRGRLDLALQLDFRQPPKQAPEIKLGGAIKLHQLGLQLAVSDGARDPAWQDWFSLEGLELGLAEVQPLRRLARFDHLVLRAPRLMLQRDGRGQLQLPRLGQAQASAASARSKASAVTTTATSPWRLSLQTLQLDQGELAWRDAATRPAAGLLLDQLTLNGRALAWPLAVDAAGAASLAVQARLGPAGQSGPASVAKPSLGQKSAPQQSAQITGQASLSQAGLTLDWQLRKLALAWFAPYLNSLTSLQLGGELALAGQLRADARGESLQLGLRDLSLRSLQARSGREVPLTLQGLSLDQLALQWPERRVQAGRLSLQGPRVQLTRSRDGLGNWQQWWNAPAASDTPAAARADAGAVAQAGWQLQVAELQLQGGQLSLLDLAAQVLDDEPARPVGLQDVQLRARTLDWDGRQLRKPVALQLGLSLRRPDSARADATRRAPGRLQWEGQLAQSPWRASGKLRAERLPLHWADPYLDPTLGLHLQRLEGDVRGEIDLRQEAAGLRLKATLPQLLLSELRLRQARLQQGQRRSAEDLLSWQAFKLDGLQLQLAPGAPPSLSIQQAGLEDFYARMIISEQGRLNLRDLRQTEAGQAVAAAPAAAPAASAVSPGQALKLSLGGLTLKGGQVDFNDRFIKPNYSARLSALTGSLGAFSAGSPAMAPLQLQGRVAGTGLLEVSGQLNPAAAPLALDVRASATDIELAPLSPYAGKYAGYAIERGKLSTRVHYAIDPQGQLRADNQIVLNQLEFGEPIASPDATKLPVRLAVALLKDRHGVIDVNLPVSGSINDPEFSVGGVVLKLILNLLGKALTAPFSLLSGGAGAELSQLSFAPGTTRLDAAAPERLDRIAQTLADKPALQLSITGWVAPEGERRAAQAARLEEALQAELKREQRRAGLAAGMPAPLEAAQRQRLLKTVYDATKLPNKPRNLLGLAKDIPADQMSALLMDSYEVSDEQQRELALQRAVVVRDALIERGVANARLFLASPKLHRAQEAAGEPGKAWQPHVDLSLSAQ
jgi:uncharacterized protein involved in outer membrane biogenesis